MEPSLLDGDWLLVDPEQRRAVERAVVVATDPRAPGRVVVKRVKSVAADGSVVLAGDHPGHAGDELAVADGGIRGSPWFRYWPPRRMGRVR